MNKEECNQYVGGLVCKLENSTITNFSFMRKITIPIGCKNYVGGIVGSDSGNRMNGVQFDGEISYYDPNGLKASFFQMNVKPIIHGIIATLIYTMIGILLNKGVIKLKNESAS